MKIAHLSDTHLGYSSFGRQRMVPDPFAPRISVRQQEADLMSGLREAMNAIIARRPDFVVHTGDLFDSSQPAPRTVRFAMQEFWRLSEAGIPVIIIEGVHSSPRALQDGHVLALLEHIPLLRVIYGDFTSVPMGSVSVHALSHRALYQRGVPPRERVGADEGRILVTHGVADGRRYFKTGRAAAEVPVQENAADYLYVALGHCHRFAQVTGTDNAFYSGSTAPVVTGDFLTCTEWGFNWVDLSCSPMSVERVAIPAREVNIYGLHDARGLSAREILEFLARQAEALPPLDAYCCLLIDGLEVLSRRDLPVPVLDEMFKGYAGMWTQFHLREQKPFPSRWSEGAFEEQFDRLVASGEGDDDFKSDVRELGHSFLRSALRTLGAEDAETADV